MRADFRSRFLERVSGALRLELRLESSQIFQSEPGEMAGGDSYTSWVSKGVAGALAEVFQFASRGCCTRAAGVSQ